MNRFFKVISVMAVLLLAGCGVKDKIAETATEKILEKSTGSDKVKVDSKKGKVTVAGDEGELFSFGDTEWPDGELASSLPKFEKGKIISVIESQAMVMISFEDVSVKEFSDYYEIIEKEYANESYKTNSEGYLGYSASNDKGHMIQLSYAEGNMSINLFSDEE